MKKINQPLKIRLFTKPNEKTKKKLDEILVGCSLLYKELLNELKKRDKEKLPQLTTSEYSQILTKLRKENKTLKTINPKLLNKVITKTKQVWNTYLRNKKLGLVKRYPSIKHFTKYYSFTYLTIW